MDLSAISASAPPTRATGSAQEPEPARDAALRRAAEAFETVFLAEMLGHAGIGEGRESFGGGVGEQGFASLLTQEHAKALSASGGVGLAEHIFEALKARDDV